MISAFDYLAPTTLGELFDLYEKNPSSEFLAGGTDLLVELRNRKPPSLLLDLKKIDELSGISSTGEFITIGGTTTINELIESKIIRDEFPALYQAASSFGCYEIRNRATVGGSLAHASPGAEFGPVWAVLEARISIASKKSRRELPFEQFTLGPGKTALMPGEIVYSIILPKYNIKTTGMAYMRRARTRGMDLASMNCAVLVLNSDKPEIREIRIAFGALARTPDRPREVEKMLSGCEITAELMGKAKKILYERYSPRATSLRASPEYKKLMAGNLLQILLLKLGLMEDSVK
ncbi:MAG: FAD binding domain-containing protein [Candidatus Eremiobacteraeota bacterium]|nr:FAD binding domain-containing protein [Candidatus Eremiobacteraeota bacterium]